MRILTVIGARPQFVKAAVVSRAIQKRPGISEVLVHTGQHYDANMSDVFFSELELPPPSHHLGVGSGSHGKQTARMLELIEAVLVDESPDCMLVYGDTNSTLAGALAAAKLHIPVAHVEAGLRSHNRRMPEEINRILTDHLSDLLFAPTRNAVESLTLEGIQGGNVVLCGDVMYDAALYYAQRARERTNPLAAYGLEPKGYILTTVHRAENTDDASRLREIVAALRQLALRMPVVLPLHPRTCAAIKRLDIDTGALHIIAPVGFLDMVALESGAALIATDSGGVQKEAFFHRVPCVTFRDETEWRELVDGGYNHLTGADRKQIVSGADQALASKPDWKRELYGDGDASGKIVEALLRSAAGGATHGR
jgi:UDP-GlcNAc3NAcA epimerase